MSNTIAIVNDGEATIEFWLEPWGDGEMLPPASSATVSFAAQDPMQLRIEVQPGRVIVWVESPKAPTEVASRRLFVMHDASQSAPADGGS